MISWQISLCLLEINFLFRQPVFSYGNFFNWPLGKNSSPSNIRATNNSEDIFAPFLPVFSAAKIHSSAIVMNSSAALFLAQDEGGKTTVAKNSNGGTVLCDDQVILRRENGIIVAYGSPWGLITTPFESARVGAFFLLEQAEQFELIPIDPVAVMEYMWKEDRGYRMYLPKQLSTRLFEILFDAFINHVFVSYRDPLAI